MFPLTYSLLTFISLWDYTDGTVFPDDAFMSVVLESKRRAALGIPSIWD